MEVDKPYDAGNEENVNDAKGERKRQREQELEDVRFLLKHPSGIRFLQRLMANGRVFNTTFTGNSHGMFWEGHRNLALVFFNDVVEINPTKIADLMVIKK